VQHTFGASKDGEGAPALEMVPNNVEETSDTPVVEDEGKVGPSEVI